MLKGEEKLLFRTKDNINYLNEYFKETYQYQLIEILEFSLNGFGSLFHLIFKARDLRTENKRIVTDSLNVSFIAYGKFIDKNHKKFNRC